MAMLLGGWSASESPWKLLTLRAGGLSTAIVDHRLGGMTTICWKHSGGMAALRSAHATPKVSNISVHATPACDRQCLRKSHPPEA